MVRLARIMACRSRNCAHGPDVILTPEFTGLSMQNEEKEVLKLQMVDKVRCAGLQTR